MTTNITSYSEQPAEGTLVEFCQDVAESRWFMNFILLMIGLAGILVGIETSKEMVEKYGFALESLGNLVLWIFVVEAAIKILAHGKRPLDYFKNPWNVFDFTVVTLSLVEPVLPLNTAFLPVLRLARILRVLRLVAVIPDLRLLVGTLFKSISSISYIGLFLMLLFYIFGTMGVFLFGDNDPIHFGNLAIAMLTLYRIVTLEDWTDVMYINMLGCDQYGYDGNPELCTTPVAYPAGSVLYFVIFVLIGTMIVLNLFIGVILNSMDQVKEEREKEQIAQKSQMENRTIGDEIELIHGQLAEINKHLEILSHRYNVEASAKES